MSSGPGYAKHPEHTLELQPFAGEVVVDSGDGPVASSRRALALREADYPPVYYVPRIDIEMDRLSKTEHHTHCPFKGDASYFDVDGSRNAAWSYEAPYDEMASIKEYIAFDESKGAAVRVTADERDAAGPNHVRPPASNASPMGVGEPEPSS